MTVIKTLFGGCLLAAAVITLPTVNAGSYPKTMKANIEVVNSGHQDLKMTMASWVHDAEGLNRRGIAADTPSKRFTMTYQNPSHGSSVFSYATEEGKTCEFYFSHTLRNGWFGFPKTIMEAKAESIGSVDAECTAAVVDGQNSLEKYSVRFTMK